jgi:hypothetical protein
MRGGVRAVRRDVRLVARGAARSGSRELLPKLAEQEPQTLCDVLVIDGDHSFNGVHTDISVARGTTLWNNATVVLFDDVDTASVRSALLGAESRGLLTIVERFTADFNVDQVFSSQQAHRPQWTFPKTWPKVFVEARFVGRGPVPRRDPRLAEGTLTLMERAEHGPGFS